MQMKIALIGASGYVGSALFKEALARGLQDTPALTAQLGGVDAVVSAFSGHAQSDVFGYYVQGIRSVIAAAKEARAPRLLVVGGAGSLEVAPGVQLLDTPEFPAQWKGTA